MKEREVKMDGRTDGDEWMDGGRTKRHRHRQTDERIDGWTHSKKEGEEISKESANGMNE
jgi:hypothetical protein